MMQAAIGTSQLLARPGDRRLHLLDTLGATLWDLKQQGWSASDLAGLLAEHFEMRPASAAEHVQAQQQLWRDAGLLEDSNEALPFELPDAERWRLEQPDDPCWPAPRPHSLPPGARRFVAADRCIALHCADPHLQACIDHALGAAHALQMHAAQARDVEHALTLAGTPDAWRLTLDDATVSEGTSADAALLSTLSILTELGCRPAERLLVVHGAGLVTPKGQGVLLVAPGGSGKTTLAAALDADGFGLLSDDVVPVTMTGHLLGLGLPLCLKPGSWPVLQHCRSKLFDSPPMQRFGQAVRFLPPCNPAPGLAVPTACLLLTRYAPGEPASHERITPEQALQGLVEAEAVFRNITQAKLDALAQWLNTVPAYKLQYPDLASGMQRVHMLAAEPSPST